MGKKTEVDAKSRRNFLKMASVSAPAAVAAVSLTGTTAEAAGLEEKESGLRDTAHTRAYYESAKF